MFHLLLLIWCFLLLVLFRWLFLYLLMLHIYTLNFFFLGGGVFFHLSTINVSSPELRRLFCIHNSSLHAKHFDVL